MTDQILRLPVIGLPAREAIVSSSRKRSAEFRGYRKPI